MAQVLSGIVSETVYPQYEGLYGMPDQFWRMSAQVMRAPMTVGAAVAL